MLLAINLIKYFPKQNFYKASFIQKLIVFWALFGVAVYSGHNMALTIRVKSEASYDVASLSLSSNDGAVCESRVASYEFFPVRFNEGMAYIDNLSIGCISSYQQDETITILKESGGENVLPEGTSARLLKLLAEGWQSSITSFAPKKLERQFGDAMEKNPTCYCIMNHIAFDISDFSGFPDSVEIKQVQFKPRKVSEITQFLSIGDLIIISNKAGKYDNDTMMYLGNNLFLSWLRGPSCFRVQDASHVEKAAIEDSVIHWIQSVDKLKEGAIAVKNLLSSLSSDCHIQ